MDITEINLNKIIKMGHDELVKLAQKLKRKNNSTVDRLFYKYSKQLKELNITYIRDRITKDTSDEKLIQHIQDAYSNLTVGGGGKLGAKELKDVDNFNRELEPELYEILYKKFLSLNTDEQITQMLSIIGSGVADAENMFKGSRIDRTNKLMEYLQNNDLLDTAVDRLT